MLDFLAHKYFSLISLVLLLLFAPGLHLDAEAIGAIPPVKSNAAVEALPQTLRNWGLENAAHSDIDARDAWAISQGSKQIVVAIIDTGIDPEHPALKKNLWQKTGAKGQEYGWDFVLNEPNPRDIYGHGTHVAGIIGAALDSKSGVLGIAGVAPKVSIMAIRFVSDASSDADTVENTVKAIHYAIDNGANIINYSAGGRSFSAREKQAIELAGAKGILFVAAAGNSHSNADREGNKFYPASYGLDNIISVAGTDQENRLVSSSNWGPETVHLTAPGENIFSTLPGGRYGYLTGTSQSAAFVTGTAVLLMARDPSLRHNPGALKAILVNSVDKFAALKEKVSSGGRLNAYSALKAAAAHASGNSFAGATMRTDRAPARESN